VDLDLNGTTSSDAPAASSSTAEQGGEEVDPRVGEYHHPTRGMMHTYMFENTRNTRIYYDDRVNNWARMPLAWERNVDEVKAMLQEIDVLLPRWKNVNEQMLAIRECNYDLQDTIIFAEINWGYKPYEDMMMTDPGMTKLERQLTRSGFVTGGDKEDDEDLGVLSNAAQSKIYNLEKKLAAAEKQVTTLEQALEEKTARKLKVGCTLYTCRRSNSVSIIFFLFFLSLIPPSSPLSLVDNLVSFHTTILASFSRCPLVFSLTPLFSPTCSYPAFYSL